MEIPARGLRLLSLDGGGVRGLSALEILAQLMKKIDPVSPPKPCDFFDLIGGTSTGGLIAIMLGRLKMSVAECIEAYVLLSDRIFQKQQHRFKSFRRVQGRFDSEALQRAITDIIVRQGLEADEPMKGTPDSACKVFVCAQNTQTADTVRFRSYNSTRSRDIEIKIWEAARATSAATTFFDPLKIDSGETFTDGAGSGVNNPIYELWTEAQDLWKFTDDSLESSVKCLVSIGTGVPSLTPFDDKIIDIGKMLVKMATETEKTAERFARDKGTLGNSGRYYRFNVDKGLENIGLESTKEKGAITAATGRYIESQVVFKQFIACADMLRLDSCKLAFQPANCQSKYERVKSFPSAEWLFEHQEYNKWSNRKSYTPNGQDQAVALLTLKGNPDTGKSVLIKEAVCRTIQMGNPKIIVLSHFFGESKKSTSSSLQSSSEEFYCSILFQLLDRLDHKPWSFISKWGKSLLESRQTPPWTVPKLQDAIHEIILSREYSRSVEDFEFRIFVDALEECCYEVIDDHYDVRSRQPLEILQFVSDLLKRTSAVGVNVKVCVSRKHDPSYGTSEPASRNIVVDNHIRPSVEAFIERELEKIEDKDLRRKLLRIIIERSTNEFLWPTLVLRQIEENSDSMRPKDLLDLVDKLPDELSKVYEHHLCTGGALKNSKALVLLQMVLGASRPMLADEFRHALAFSGEYGELIDIGIDEWEDSGEGFRRGDAFRNYIRRESRGLLEIYPGSGPQARVRFVHGSVATFLSTHNALTILGETSLTLFSQRYHLFLLKTCLRTLDFCKLRGEEKVSFVEYACESWVYHARNCGGLIHTLKDIPSFLQNCTGRKASRVIERNIQKLRDASAKEWFLVETEKSLLVLLATLGCTQLLQRHLNDCRFCKDACLKGSDEPEVYRKALKNAVISGRTETAGWLLDTHCDEGINMLLDGATLLYRACRFGDHEVVKFLLSKGADPFARSRNKYEYPLHVAIELGHNNIVQELLLSSHTNTAELYKLHRRRDGATAFHMAICSGQGNTRKMPVFNTLIRNAPKGIGLLDLLDNKGETPMSLARKLQDEDSDDIQDDLDDFCLLDAKPIQLKDKVIVDIDVIELRTMSLGGETVVVSP